MNVPDQHLPNPEILRYLPRSNPKPQSLRPNNTHVRPSKQPTKHREHLANLIEFYETLSDFMKPKLAVTVCYRGRYLLPTKIKTRTR